MGSDESSYWNPGSDKGAWDGLLVSDLLHTWQESGDVRALEELVVRIAVDIRDTARAVLARYRIRDDDAVDDVVSLVLDHVRRLDQRQHGSKQVSPFTPAEPDGRNHNGSTDTGRAYIRWLTQKRALDVSRLYRRRNRREISFTALSSELYREFSQQAIADSKSTSLADERLRNLKAALSVLDRREREVLTLLLDGDSQDSIAKKLGVHEGTVSRVRTRAVESLRRILLVQSEHVSNHPAHRSRRSPR